MSSPQSPYRERALERGDVREALDERVRVVSAPRWIALALGVLLIIGLLAWSASKEVQTTIDAQGVLALEGGNPRVVAPLAGVVVSLPPSPGSPVQAGEVVAKLDTGRGPPLSVTALIGGTINTVPVTLGTYVDAGDVLATITPAGAQQPLVYLFVTASQASEISRGMTVTVTPMQDVSQASVLLHGRVDSVQGVPDTDVRLINLLGTALAATFEKVPVDEVAVKLAGQGTATPDGYRWSTSAGSVTLRLGARLSGRIVLKQESPLGYIF